MAPEISAASVRRRLAGRDEIALLDVREHGQYGEGHPLFAVPAPYSRLELDATRLVPRRSAPVVLLDDGDGVATRAARCLEAIGYTDVAVLEGGAPGWAGAGFTLFKGVNVPSKVFGELVEHACHTPSMPPEELAERRDRGEAIVILDGRTPAEYRRMNIPGGISCPNAELAHRVGALVDDDRTTVVVNCAGRTRSIIGAQSLIDAGVANPVIALENGTQGWQLAGFELERGAARGCPEMLDDSLLAASRQRAAAVRERFGIPTVDRETLARWRDDASRTLFVLDVRTEAEFAAGTGPGAVHAPGGQLVQGTDQWIGVRGARVVLVDDTGLRAAMTARWLRGMGHDAVVLDADVAGDAPPVAAVPVTVPEVREVNAPALLELLGSGDCRLIDIRASNEFRESHLADARWLIRPRIVPGALDAADVVLISDDAALAALAAIDCREAGAASVRWLGASAAQCAEAGFEFASTPDEPAASEAIDYLYFVHDRHSGNLDAARQYLAWEVGLIEQLDETERAGFAP